MSLKMFLLEKLFQYHKARGFKPDYITPSDLTEKRDPADNEQEKKDKSEKAK
jgi:hypothetical protein